MKKYSALLIILFGIAACQQPAVEIPEDLESKKQLLAALKTDRINLEQKIKVLEEEIEAQDPNQEKPKKLVTVDTLIQEDFKRYIEIQGAVESSNVVNAAPEIGGRIIHMTLEEGDYIKQGSLVAKLDVESINKQIEELEKSLELANDLFERQERLWKQEIGSEIQFLQAKNNKERIEKSLESIKFQLTKANVYSPITGYVDRVFSKQGEFAAPGAPIVQVINTHTVKVVADVPESLLGKVRRGEYVNIEFPALDKTMKGRVSLIGRTIDPSNRTFKIEIQMKNPGNQLKPNLLSIVMINDLTVEETIAIPLELVQQEISGKDYVFVVTPGEEGLISEKRYVSTGPTFANNIVIENGLNPGERIIVDGSRSVSTGDLLEIQ